MPIILTHLITPSTPVPAQHQVYCGLDNCVTHEVMSAIQAQNFSVSEQANQPNLIYNFERALQAPALDMMLRGWKIDEYERRQSAILLRQRILRVSSILNRLVTAIRGTPLQPRPPREAHRAVPFTFVNSNDQLCEFFYGVVGLPEVFTFKKGERKRSMDREALEKLEMYWQALPVINCLLAIRDYEGQLGTIETQIDQDGRWRQSYNIAGTETGRPSSSTNAFGTGDNMMNISADLRKMFISDPGWKLCAIDFEQSEARDLGYWMGVLFNDWTYLDACEGADLHTYTSRLAWPGLSWSGNPKLDRALAEEPYYRHFSRRDLAKRGGHGSNYLVAPPSLAKHLKIPLQIAQEFQERYFSAFPGIPRLHRWVAQELETKQRITSFFGRERHFFGRPNDDTTLREAVANMGQSPTADRTSLAMWRIWKKMPEVQLLNEVYDAVYFQYREEDEAEVVPRALAQCKVELRQGSRTFVVPAEAKVGWNWAYHHEHGPSCKPGCSIPVNPDGLAKFKGKDSRQRHTGLNRIL